MSSRLLPLPGRALLRAALCSGGLLATLALAACDSGGELPEPSDLAYGQLLAPPTADELQAILDDWAGRANAATAPTILALDSLAGDSTATLYLVSHGEADASGSTFTHYGLVRIPDGATGLPVLVIHHGDGDGFAVSHLLSELDRFPQLKASTVQVVPVYRSETLTADVGGLAGQGALTAGGAFSPWDYDVDDALSLLDAALQLFPDQLDATRVAALGDGRGGTTALLHAVRDDRVLAVADYYGPADFMNNGVRPIFEGAVGGAPDTLAFPNADYLRDTILEPLLAETLSYDEARLAFLRRSPGFFGEFLPDTQVHHHRRDPVVPVGFTQAFASRVAGGEHPNAGSFNAQYYDTTLPDGVASYHSLDAMPTSFEMVDRFLFQRLQLPTAR